VIYYHKIVYSSRRRFIGGFIVEQLDPSDVIKIWGYDLSWLIIIDLVKMAIIRIQARCSRDSAEIRPRA